MSRPKGGKERPTQLATAFDSEQLAHLPFMELFSSGEFPSVVAARRCSSCAFSFDVRCRCRCHSESCIPVNTVSPIHYSLVKKVSLGNIVSPHTRIQYSYIHILYIYNFIIIYYNYNFIIIYYNYKIIIII